MVKLSALHEILATGHFEIQDQQATGRNRWVAIMNPATVARQVGVLNG